MSFLLSLIFILSSSRIFPNTYFNLYRYIQNAGGIGYCYGVGDESGAAGADNWQINRNDFKWEHAPGSNVGDAIHGVSGTTSWNGVEKAIIHAMKSGKEMGTDVHFIQGTGGTAYHYGEGESSGAAGSNNFRFLRL